MRTPLLSAGESNCRFWNTRSHNCSPIRSEITNVWTSCRTAAGESACSSWMTVSMGSNLTRSLYLMATFVPSTFHACVECYDGSLDMIELDELRVAGFRIGQPRILKVSIPRGDNSSVAARHLEQTDRIDLQAGVEKDLQVVQEYDFARYGSDYVF